MTPIEHLQLPDGRTLDYSISGPAEGLTLVFHHGTPGACTPVRAIDRAAHERGFRLLCASRAGYGGSSPRPGRLVVDVVEDTRALLEAIGIDRCAVAGWSGGGPHALACAARLECATAALVIAGVAPSDAVGLPWMEGMGEDNVREFSLAMSGEQELRPFLDEARQTLKGVTAEGIVASLESLLPDVDRVALTGDFGEDMATSFHEGLRVGVEGWLEDDLAFTQPWGFELNEISIPTMLWQGERDLMVPFAHGEWLAAHIPGVSAHLEAGEGHLSIGLGAIGRILDELASAAS